MGTTRIKVIDLSSQDQEIKTSRKHAEKLSGAAKIKDKAQPKDASSTKQEVTQDPNRNKSQDDISENSEKENLSEIEKPKPSEKTAAPAKKPKTALKTSASKNQQGKKYLEAKKLLQDKPYKIKEAFEVLPKTSAVKFDAAVEVHLNVADKNMKGSINFPHSFGAKQKKTKYLVFTDQKPTSDTNQSIIWGNESTIAEIEKGNLKPGRDFDQVISSPKFMPSLAKIAKILGPKGMMPNPKNGTVTENFEKVTSSSDTSSYSFKSDPTAPIIHAKIGKISQSQTELFENLKTLTLAIGVSKIKKATLTSTMGPAIRLDVSSL